MRFACWMVVAVAFHLTSTCAGEYVVELAAGSGKADNNGDARPARETNIGHPFGVELGPDGALYLTEIIYHRVRRVDLETGGVTTVAGSGRRGYSGDGGPAAEAELNEPYEVRFDRAGHMYVVDMQNHAVRRIDAESKTISTVAGIGAPGFGGDGGPAIEARLRQPHSIALDERGGLYIADIGNHRIRRVDLKTGIIETIAGTGERSGPEDGEIARGRAILGPRALYVRGEALWVALREGHAVWRMDLAEGKLHHVAGVGVAGYSGDGSSAKNAKFNGPKGIAVDPQGDIFVADTENNAIRRIDATSGLITTIAGARPNQKKASGTSVAITPDRLRGPHGLCVGSKGDVYVADTLNHRVLRLRPKTASGASNE